MRIRTLMSVLWTIVAGLVWFTAVLTILGQVGVNVTPILASAGVVPNSSRTITLTIVQAP